MEDDLKCKPAPAAIGHFFNALDLSVDYNLRVSLWLDLVRFHEDPLHPHRRSMHYRTGKALVHIELRNFLRLHGHHYFSEENLTFGARVYKDSLSSKKYATGLELLPY